MANVNVKRLSFSNGAQPMNLEAELKAIIQKQTGGKAGEFSDHTLLAGIGLDSLDLIEIVFEIEDRFQVELPKNFEEVASFTFGDLLRLVEQLQTDKGAAQHPA
jgi:acyl carrier protein